MDTKRKVILKIRNPISSRTFRSPNPSSSILFKSPCGQNVIGKGRSSKLVGSNPSQKTPLSDRVSDIISSWVIKKVNGMTEKSTQTPSLISTTERENNQDYKTRILAKWRAKRNLSIL